MKLKRLFYDSSVDFRSIPISKLVCAFIIGISSTIVIYSFFQVLSETFRTMSIGYGNTPQILSNTNRNFYNLFFSGLSVVFGNSIVLNFLFSKPQRITHRFNSKRRTLLNDQIFLSFNFSYWFTKIGLVFGVFSMCCMDFEFLPYFKYISILLLVVLYLESLKSLGQLLNNSQRFKFIVVHISVLLFVTFSLSKLNVVDYRSLEKLMLENSPIMDYPYSNFHNDDESNYRYSIELRLKVEDNHETFIYADDRKWRFDDIPRIIAIEKASMREELIPFLNVNIVSDKNIKISNIKELEFMLYKVNQRLISYTVRSDDLLFSRFERRGIKKIISQDILNFKRNADYIKSPEIPFEINTKIKDTIKILVGNKILFGKEEILNNKDLENRFHKADLETTIFEYNYESDVTFQVYISVLSSHLSAIEKLRKDNQTIFRSNEYERNKSFDEEQKQLREAYPIFILEKFD